MNVLLLTLALSSGALGGLFTGLVFFAVGLAIFLWGRSYASLDRAIAKWPKAPGVITESKYASETGTVRDQHGYDVTSTQFRPAITFQYTVNGATFGGTKVTRADESTSSSDAVMKVVNRYPAGARVEVLYDPSAPSTAYLEAGRSFGALFLMIFGGFFLFIGALVSSLMLAFAR